jgi:hypothetical protein
LLHELEGRSAHPDPVVLIVDDYQVIEEQAIHQGMSFFLEHLPAKMHLVLASRVDPGLPLARLRVRGQLRRYFGQNSGRTHSITSVSEERSEIKVSQCSRGKGYRFKRSSANSVQEDSC